MPTNPNEGTGYADWGQYLAANADTINQDRGTVQSYLQGQDQQVRKNGQGIVDANAQAAQGQGSGPDWGQYTQLQTNAGALGTPEGFEQVLGQAQPSKAGGNSFDAALEGQNASSLYNTTGLDSYLSGLHPSQPAGAGPGRTAGQPAPGPEPTHDTGNGPGMPTTGYGGRPQPERPLPEDDMPRRRTRGAP